MSQYNRSNISALLSKKLPEFIRQDHPNFVVFLEEYYKWLESKDNEYFAPLKLEGLVNIDTTVDDFLDYFKTLFFDGFPENYKSVKGDEVDVALILKKIRSFYQSKGTEASIKFLMTLLFDVYSEIYIPSEDIFKASGGRWNQPTIVRCIDSNPATNRTFRNLKVDFYDSSNSKIGSARIKDLKQFTKSGYHVLELDLVEITGITSYPGTIQVKQKDGSFVTLKLVPFITNIDVTNSGSYYSLDDEVTITTVSGYNGVGAKASVQSLTPTGGIRSIRIDDPGLFYYPLNNTYVHYNVSVNTQTGTGASGFEITTGTKVKKPGFYENNDGQLSSTEKLQDNYRYQIHSYVVRTEATLSEYEKTLRKLTHPAGKLVLGDYFVYRTESATASNEGSGLIAVSEPYLANYLPYTIAELSDGATTELGVFGVLPSHFDLRGVSSEGLSGSTQDPPFYFDYFPFGYDGATGYTLVDEENARTSFQDGISSGWDSQNFNIFGGMGSSQEFFARKRINTAIINFYEEQNDNTGFYNHLDNAFSIGGYVHQGEDGPTQARGRILNWKANPLVTTPATLTVEVLNGEFVTGLDPDEVPTGNTSGCIAYGLTQGEAYTGGGNLKSIIQFWTGDTASTHDENAFSPGDVVYEYNSSSAGPPRGTVLGWSGGTYGTLTIQLTRSPGGIPSEFSGDTDPDNSNYTNRISFVTNGGTAYTGGGVLESLITFRTGGNTHADDAFTVGATVSQGNAEGVVIGWTGGTYGQLALEVVTGDFQPTTTSTDPLADLTTVYDEKIVLGADGSTYTGGGNDRAVIAFWNGLSNHSPSAFTVGEKVHQGEFGDDQARGTVIGWISALASLTLRVDNGSFRVGTKGEVPTGVTTGCIVFGETTGTPYTAGGSSDGNSGGYVVIASSTENYYNGGIVEGVSGLPGHSGGHIISIQTEPYNYGGFVTNVVESHSLQYIGTTLPGWPSNDTTFWIVHPHPNTWHGNVPAGATWGGIVLQDFIRTPYNLTSPPQSGSSYGSQGTLGASPNIPSGYGEGI